MSWTLSLLLVVLCRIGEPSVFGDELALIGRTDGRMTELLVADAAIRASVLTWLASVEEAMGDSKAAEKARAAADDALELALTDRQFAQHFLGDARALLARSRTQPYPPGRAPGLVPLERPGVEPESGDLQPSPVELRAELRDARSGR
jgi:hypothetical protein